MVKCKLYRVTIPKIELLRKLRNFLTENCKMIQCKDDEMEGIAKIIKKLLNLYKNRVNLV